MGIFDYRGADGRDLMLDAMTLIDYSYHGLFEGERERYVADGYNVLSVAATGVETLLLADSAERNDYAVANVTAAGWTILTAADLGLPDSRTDEFHTFSGATSQFRNAQADVLGKYDENGNLIEIGFVIRGTSGPLDEIIGDTFGDVFDYLEFLSANPNYTQEAFADVLEAVRDLALANGLTAGDVLVTGHSLGGGATMNLAETSHTFLDGFFTDANYIGAASHYVVENGAATLSNGAEVFTFDLENDPIGGAIVNGIPQLLGNSNDYAFSTNNIVLFNDLYDTPVFSAGSSPANLLAWTAHLDHAYFNAFNTIVRSSFYDEFDRDSVIVIADLSDQRRDNTWVEDIDLFFVNTGHHGDDAYILGSLFDDRLRGQEGGDALEGFAGDDWLKGGAGNDRLIGGDGDDLLEGGSGKDVLHDGAGRDELNGGWGRDVFVFAADGEADHIQSFQEGNDLIDVSAWGVTSFGQLSIQNLWGDDVRVSFGNEVLTVDDALNTLWFDLEANDFLFA
ncbi:MAG: triacylglycerol lipase [Pseudomonadota bacterium]